MVLIDLMELYDENKPLYVFKDNVLIALSDGRESIPERLNGRKVACISTHKGGLMVNII